MELSVILLIIAIIFLFYMIKYLGKTEKKKKTVTLFANIFKLMLLWNASLLLQNLLAEPLNINPIYFDYLAYVGIIFLPVYLYLTARSFSNSKFKIKIYHLFLFVIPIISTCILWTNDFHNLFYTEYSIYVNEAKFGNYFNIHTLYTYILIAISLIILLKHSIKQNHKISAQSLLFLLAIAAPVAINLVGMLNLMPVTIYMTPISFTASTILIFIGIFKFDFLNINTIALNLIVNSISDSYIVLDQEMNITSCNDAFLKTFKINKNNFLNKNIFSVMKTPEEKDSFKITLELIASNNQTINIQKHYKEIDKYFSVDISPILKEKVLVGILIFLKDITQIEHDKIQIQNNQNMLIERERLASLGQMVGGIAHNLKTPIFSISGGLEGLGDLITEFDESIEDENVNDQDMHDIAKDMQTWITKLKGHTSYMSDVITAVKGQASKFTDEQAVEFNIEELFQHVKVLMQHEIKHTLSTLNITNKVDNSIIINGNINSLVQVINNLISNSIEAYSKTNKEKIINLNAEYNKKEKNIIISIQDLGSGLPQIVQEKLFKEMITTKGKNGTGLGLFMSYSNIKAHFKGDMTFETKENEGTTFFIKIPV